jgi:hypothetical protein
MRRGLLTLGVLLTLAISQSKADYLVIKVDVNQVFNKPASGQSNTMPGMFPGMMPGMVGGGPGARPGGQGGVPFPPQMQPPRGAGKGGGFPGGVGSTPPGGIGSTPPGKGGFPGGVGSMPPGGVGSMPPGGIGSTPPGKGGFPGGIGSMPPGGAGKGGPGGIGSMPPGGVGSMPPAGAGSMPPGGIGSIPGMGGMSGMGMMFGLGDQEAPPRYLYAFLELKVKPKSMTTQGKKSHIQIDHAWGKNCKVPLDLVLSEISMASTTRELAKRKTEIRDSKNPARMLQTAEWALEHGMLKDFHEIMADLQKMTGVPPMVQAALTAYAKIQADLKNAPKGDDPAQATLISSLKSQGYHAMHSEQGHYTLLTNVASGESDKLKKKLQLMENTFEKFFYWFSFHSTTALPSLPSHRLLAVVIAQEKQFRDMHKQWGSLPLVGDGFLPRRENIVVMAAEHLDATFKLLKDNIRSHAGPINVSKKELLSGEVWKRQVPSQSAHEVILLQTLAVVEKAVEQDAERNTVTHLATRQLLFATGLLPKNVAVPEWIQYGLASFFETPEASFYPSMALPSSTNLIDFKYYRRKDKLKPARSVLLQVITDSYFHRAADSARAVAERKESDDKDKDSKAAQDPKRPSNSLLRREKEDREIARSTAWALVYHLARENKLGYLVRYSEELDRLPRDLELSPKVLQGCLLRALELVDEKQLQQFADAWFAAMENYSLEVAEYERSEMNARMNPPVEPPPATNNNNRPGFPGGFPFPGAGGPGGGFPFPGGGGAGSIPGRPSARPPRQ